MDPWKLLKMASLVAGRIFRIVLPTVSEGPEEEQEGTELLTVGSVHIPEIAQASRASYRVGSWLMRAPAFAILQRCFVVENCCSLPLSIRVGWPSSIVSCCCCCCCYSYCSCHRYTDRRCCKAPYRDSGCAIRPGTKSRVPGVASDRQSRQCGHRPTRFPFATPWTAWAIVVVDPHLRRQYYCRATRSWQSKRRAWCVATR
mmetsp:Transcript_1771/g.4837  ORF Transcript_1771/g.4837 Transcript_1771/m.4837 type:complete len:201 (+) Transcript_1771:563-1165(+)